LTSFFVRETYVVKAEMRQGAVTAKIDAVQDAGA